MKVMDKKAKLPLAKYLSSPQFFEQRNPLDVMHKLLPLEVATEVQIHHFLLFLDEYIHFRKYRADRKTVCEILCSLAWHLPLGLWKSMEGDKQLSKIWIDDGLTPQAIDFLAYERE